MAANGAQSPCILASASPARARLLEAAGISIDIRPAVIDEAAIRDAINGEGMDTQPGDVAMILAQAKATTVSETASDTIVIGADQVLVCDGTRFDKPRDTAAARDQLIALRGRTHALISAVACARDGEVVWSHDATANLTMRDFSNEFLGTYLAAIGEDALASVGCYQLEAMGAQLFEAIDGDYFTILGLPLIPLLAFLRAEGVLAT